MMNIFTLPTETISSATQPSQINSANMATCEFMIFCQSLYDHIFLKHQVAKDGRATRQDFIFEKFMNYVQQYCTEQRNLTFYADKLCLTPKYLSYVVKKHSGKSANVWIDEFVICEAKVLLKSTNLTILQISDKLNFSTPSFFSKYFKQRVGLTPKEYIRTIV